MRVGLIAASTDRGLGNQCREVYRHINPDVTVVVDPGPDRIPVMPAHPEWYPDGHVILWQSDGTLPGALDLLSTCDVVYSAETYYDWSLPAELRKRGVRTVLHANPELYTGEDVDVLWFPTPWLADRFPNPIVVPMPAPVEYFPEVAPMEQPFRIVHPAGVGAAGDRNGTIPFAKVARLFVKGGYRVDMTGPNGEVLGNRVRSVEHWWERDPGASVSVIPRRYGGLCLLDGSMVTTGRGRIPIEDVIPGDKITDRLGSTVVTATSRRVVSEAVTISARGVLLTSSSDHLHMIADSRVGDLIETKANDVEVGQWVFIKRPSGLGIDSVDMGPKPIRRGLRFWPERLDLDEGWARIIGLYLAEGHSGLYARKGRDRPSPTIVWNFGLAAEGIARELVELLKARGLNPSITKCESEGTFGFSRVWRIRVRSLWLYEAFDRLGLGGTAWVKRAPDVPSELVPALVGGWLDGDGTEDNGLITGWSQSRQMIRDFWRLVAKTGIMASISHDGCRLNVSRVEDAAVVALWTRRLRPTRTVSRIHRPSTWHEVDLGWMVKVGSVEKAIGPHPVTALETKSGTYVANDILTHNCLPAAEALAAGVPVVMPDVSPQSRSWPIVPVRHRRARDIKLKGGLIPQIHVTPEDVYETVIRLLAQPERLEAERKRAREWAVANSWDALLPRWRQAFSDALLT